MGDYMKRDRSYCEKNMKMRGASNPNLLLDRRKLL